MKRVIGALLVGGWLVGGIHSSSAAGTSVQVAKPTVSTNSDGSTNLTVQITPPESNKKYSFYVAAIYQGKIYFLTNPFSNGQQGTWVVWDGVTAHIPSVIDTMNAVSITVLSQMNVSGLVGTQFYAGVGLNPDDLLANGTVTSFYTVPKPACNVVDCLAFDGTLEFQTQASNAAAVKQLVATSASMTNDGRFTANSANGCVFNGQLAKNANASLYGAINLWSGLVQVSNCASSVFNGSQNMNIYYDPSKKTLTPILSKLILSTYMVISVSGDLQGK